MSGSVTSQWEVQPHQKDLIERQARVLGCPDDSLNAIMDCFKTVIHIIPILAKSNKFFLLQKNGTHFGNSVKDMFEYNGGNPIYLWKPVVEEDFGQERFLHENPTRLFRQGRFARIPIMAGITEFEFFDPALGNQFYFFN